MHSTDDLHRLIHSLGKAEKRYFKLFASMGAGRAHKHTVDLFDRISEMDVYDEVALKNQIQDESLSGNFASAKNRLYELVLKSQRLLHSGSTIDSQLSETLQDLELLFEKALAKAARKKIRKAKALAMEYEKEASLLRLLDWEQKFFVLHPDEEESAFYQRNEEEEMACIKRLALQRSLQRQYEQIRSLARGGHQTQNKEMGAKFAQILNHPDLATAPPTESFLSTQIYNAIRGVYALARGKAEKAWDIFHLVMQGWNQKPERIADSSDFYLGCYNNFITACTSTKTHNEEYFKAVQNLRLVKGMPSAFQLKLERIAFFQELNLRIEFGKFEDGSLFIEELSTWLKKNNTLLQDMWVLIFSGTVTLFYFVHSEFSKSQKWLNNVLNFPATEARADIRDFARIFQLVLQYELKNLDVQEYLLRSAYRYFSRTQKLHDYEEALLTFMKAEQKTAGTDRKATKAAFEKLHASLLAIRSASNEAEPVGMQVLLFWIESHLEGVPLKVYYTRKVEEQLAGK